MTYNVVSSTITYLKITSKIKYNLEAKPFIHLFKVNKPITAESYLKYYKSVGENLNWLDRIFMNKEVLQDKINSDKTQIFTFSIYEKFAGYCELIIEEKYVEILYFGLTEPFIGKGYGKYLLSKIIEKAWSYHPEWIQLNTCDLDHPNALSTYKSMGFSAFKTISEMKKVKVK